MRRRSLLLPGLLVVVALGCSSGPSSGSNLEGWEYSSGMGFINRGSMEKKTPAEFYQFALALKEQKHYLEAVAAFSLIVNRVPDPLLRENAHFERAGVYAMAGGYYEAYHDYESFILRFPQSERVTLCKRLEMGAALDLARVGQSTFFGLSSTQQTGVDYLHDALRRYPREDFASDFSQKLGMFHYERDEFDKAAEEFARVLDQYGDSPEAVLALYMLGRSAERRFDAVYYDVKPLKDARRHYERFIEEADRMRRLPEPGRKWVDGLLPAVRERLASIYERMIEKQLMTAEYYDWKDLPWSAEPYYRAMLNDEAIFRKTLPAFPSLKACRKARARLLEINKL
jgi:outer membrane protein assembly factor BamD (BamD/ComL family)